MGSFDPFEVTPVHLIYVGLGTFIVLFGMFSLFIKEKLYLGEAPLAAIFGIIVGPVALNLFSPSGWANNHSPAPGGNITDEITLEVMRVTIALSVFAVGVELPKKYLLRHWRSIALLLGPVMVWGWLITAAFMYALIPGLDFLNCLVVASCVTPTDPILAQAVVGGPWAEKHVPAHLRHMLMCESGCNDGAAFPFLYLALYLTTNRDNHGHAIAEWFYDAWAYQIIFGTLLGALIGWAARKLMRFSERHRLVDRESFVAQYVSLAIASMGVNVLLGSDDLLAAFACGSAFAWDGWFTRQTEDSNFSSIVDLLFNVATFIYIGALMPFQEFAGGPSTEPNTLSIWRLFVLAICVLLTKRLPIVLALWRWIPDIKTFREAIFAGHFGPIGVGAIFIATLARTRLPEEVDSPPENTNDILALTVQPVIFFFVLCSIILHGLTIPFFALSRRATTMTRTWSRNPSFMAGDSEPGWTSKFRRTKTGESISGGEGNMTEIERVLNAQLTRIGKGAIGGDAEKQLRRGDSNTSTEEEEAGSSNLSSTKMQSRGIHFIDDDYEEEHVMFKDDPVGEWGGEECIEMKRYRERLREEKEREYAYVRRKQEGIDADKILMLEKAQHDPQGGDIGMTIDHRKHDEDEKGIDEKEEKEEDEERAPMDRDLNEGKIKTREEDADVREAEVKEHNEMHQEKALEASKDDTKSHHQHHHIEDYFLGHHHHEKPHEKYSEEHHEKHHHKEHHDHEKHRQQNNEDDDEEREHAALIHRRQKEQGGYPSSRTWVEGHKLVIEHQASRSSEAEVMTIPLLGDEKEYIGKADDPLHAWVKAHAPKIEFYLGLTDVHSWSSEESANHLMHHRIPHIYNHYLSRRLKRGDTFADEKREDRDERSQVLLQSLNWAAEHRHDEDDEEEERKRHIRIVSESPPERQASGLLTFDTIDSNKSSQSQTGLGSKKKVKKVKRPPSPEDEPAVVGWLAAPPPKPRPKKPTRRASSSTSPNRGSSSGGSAMTLKQYISRPSDSRRMQIRDKVCSGQLSLGKCRSKNPSFTDELDGDFISPSDRAVKSARFYGSSRRPASLASNSSGNSKQHMMAQSASANLMGGGTTSSSSASSILLGTHPASTAGLLQIPRTSTAESAQSDKSRSSSSNINTDEDRRKHRKSSSVQWVDVASASALPIHTTIGGESTFGSNISRPHSPSIRSINASDNKVEKVDLARVGGGVTPRNQSRNPSPTRQVESIERSSTPMISRDDSSIREGQHDQDSSSHHGYRGHHRKRGRIANILSSIGAPSSHSNSHSHSHHSNRLSRLLDPHSSPQHDLQSEEVPSRTSSFYSSSGQIEGGILAPPSRTGSNIAILNDSRSSGNIIEDASPSSRANNTTSTSSPAVTFDL